VMIVKCYAGPAMSDPADWQAKHFLSKRCIQPAATSHSDRIPKYSRSTSAGLNVQPQVKSQTDRMHKRPYVASPEQMPLPSARKKARASTSETFFSAAETGADSSAELVNPSMGSTVSNSEVDQKPFVLTEAADSTGLRQVQSPPANQMSPRRSQIQKQDVLDAHTGEARQCEDTDHATHQKTTSKADPQTLLKKMSVLQVHTTALPRSFCNRLAPIYP